MFQTKEHTGLTSSQYGISASGYRHGPRLLSEQHLEALGAACAVPHFERAAQRGAPQPPARPRRAGRREQHRVPAQGGEGRGQCDRDTPPGRGGGAAAGRGSPRRRSAVVLCVAGVAASGEAVWPWPVIFDLVSSVLRAARERSRAGWGGEENSFVPALRPGSAVGPVPVPSQGRQSGLSGGGRQAAWLLSQTRVPCLCSSSCRAVLSRPEPPRAAPSRLRRGASGPPLLSHCAAVLLRLCRSAGTEGRTGRSPTGEVSSSAPRAERGGSGGAAAAAGRCWEVASGALPVPLGPCPPRVARSGARGALDFRLF